MMRFLLDTHIFLWFIIADPRLPPRFRTEIQDPSHSVYLSVASVWEAVIKYSLNKLPLPAPPEDYLPQQRDAHGISSLSIDEGSMKPLASLPHLHRDPFDRLIVAQAIQHGMTVLTIDPDVRRYPAELLAMD